MYSIHSLRKFQIGKKESGEKLLSYPSIISIETDVVYVTECTWKMSSSFCMCLHVRVNF